MEGICSCKDKDSSDKSILVIMKKVISVPNVNDNKSNMKVI